MSRGSRHDSGWDSSKQARLEHLRKLLSTGSSYPQATRPVQLLAHVYLGNLNNAECLTTLKKLAVTHVLNCAGFKGRRSYSGTPYPGLNIDYVEVFADDKEGYDITQHFEDCFRYLDSVRASGGTALVHCAMGINRSVAICAAYMMRTLNMTLIQVISLLKDKRPVVLTNFSFVVQLYTWAEQHMLLGSNHQWGNSMARSGPRRTSSPHDKRPVTSPARPFEELYWTPRSRGVHADTPSCDRERKAVYNRESVFETYLRNRQFCK